MSLDSEQLIDQYNKISQLAGGLAHEIKNPLSTIRLNMDLLAEDLEGAELPARTRAMKKVDRVKQECGRLEELLRNFLDYARADKIELVPRDVNKVLRDVVDFYRPQASASGIELSEFYANDLPTVRMDSKSFRRAILNLIINAHQAMLDGGKLVIRTRTSGNEVAIDLIDDGCGMDQRTAEHVFEAFYSTKDGGSGLGLPTVRRIVEAHAGRILMQSELGQGTQFTLLFPGVPRLTV
ncbi:MAG: two-component system sensor histidine kinase NtrB [Thermoguttaceae bacterium]